MSPNGVTHVSGLYNEPGHDGEREAVVVLIAD
jgi:hypothetical protein